MLTDSVVLCSTDVMWPCVLNLLWLVRYKCCAAEGPGAITAKMVSRAARLTSRATAEAAAPNQLPTNLQGALMAGEDDNPLFLGGLRATAANAVTDAMGAAIATGLPACFGCDGQQFCHCHCHLLFWWLVLHVSTWCISLLPSAPNFQPQSLLRKLL